MTKAEYRKKCKERLAKCLLSNDKFKKEIASFLRKIIATLDSSTDATWKKKIKKIISS